MTTDTQPTWRLVQDHVAKRVTRLQNDLLSGSSSRESAARAQLAKLRRAPVDDPSDPRVWDATLEGLPSALAGAASSDGPNRAELAIHASLVLFANHVQSTSVPRHAPGQRFGTAVRRLIGPQDDGEAVNRRFHAFATASSWNQRVWHLRGLISLLRAHDIPLDYGSLAASLYQTQTPAGLRRARLQWGRDYHRSPTSREDTIDTEGAVDAAAPQTESKENQDGPVH